jgi:hypothetical protein
VQVALEEGTDGELGGAVGGEVAEGGEGEVGVVLAVGGDEVAEGDGDEAVADLGGELAEVIDVGAEGAGEGATQREGGLVQALHEAALAEAFEGHREEKFLIKLFDGALDQRGEAAVAGLVEQLLELGGWGRFCGHRSAVA